MAIRILPCDFPRRGALALLCLLILGIPAAAGSAHAGGSITARATVLAPDAIGAAAEALVGLSGPSAGTPGFGAMGDGGRPAEREIIRGGAWIRVFEGSAGNSGAERRLQLVYLGN